MLEAYGDGMPIGSSDEQKAAEPGTGWRAPRDGGSSARWEFLETPSSEAFPSWYGSPEYAPLFAIREKFAETNLLMVGGVG
jgi:hypothetical protein